MEIGLVNELASPLWYLWKKDCAYFFEKKKQENSVVDNDGGVAVVGVSVCVSWTVRIPVTYLEFTDGGKKTGAKHPQFPVLLTQSELHGEEITLESQVCTDK